MLVIGLESLASCGSLFSSSWNFWRTLKREGAALCRPSRRLERLASFATFSETRVLIKLKVSLSNLIWPFSLTGAKVYATIAFLTLSSKDFV